MCGKIENCWIKKNHVVVDLDPLIMIVLTKRQKDKKTKRQKDKKTKMQKDKKTKKTKKKYKKDKKTTTQNTGGPKGPHALRRS